MADILVHAEVNDGKLDSTALEILTKARDLGDVSAVCLGPGAADAAQTLGEYGAQTVYVSDDEVYADHIAQPTAFALRRLIEDEGFQLVLFAMNYDSRDIAGRLSAMTGSTLMSNAVDLVDAGTARAAVFGGSLFVNVALEGDPKLVLVRPKSFEPQASGGAAKVQEISFDIPEDLKLARRIERHVEEAQGPQLDTAPVVISGGRGLQEPDNFKVLEELANTIGNAAVGATRAVVDAGWVPYAMQIGQTGITVKPNIYIAVGISGATQHIVGMKGAKTIIAINKDEEAPIFQLADLGIVGDALKVVPQLIEEIKSRKG